MAFPASPTNGQTTTINGKIYTYNSTLTAWALASAAMTGTVTLTQLNATTLSVSGVTTLAGMTATTGSFSSTLGVTGAITSGGLIQASTAGFQSATYAAGARNRIWSFGNADGYGLSYFQGTAGMGSADTIGLHFGTATAAGSQFQFVSSGNFYATGSVTAYYSDKRLKTEISKIENALDKVDQLTGILYTQNKLAEQFGYNNYEVQVGLRAQDVQIAQPEAVKPAPFDTAEDGSSKSGENYLTVQYEKLVPLLVEAIKELRVELNMLKGQK